MLDDFTVPEQKAEDELLKLYLRASNQLIQQDSDVLEPACPFTVDITNTIMELQGKPPEHKIVQEAWILFLPTCINHSSCPSCRARGPGSPTTTLSMPELVRKKAIDSSLSMITTLHEALRHEAQPVYPLVASTQALNAGCAILAGLKRQWVPTEACTVALLRCTEVLTTLSGCVGEGARSFTISGILSTASYDASERNVTARKKPNGSRTRGRVPHLLERIR